jgi:hypothetical protein
MIVAIVGTLEGFKEKLQRTIDHVKAGVTHLNEDQKEAAAMVIKRCAASSTKPQIQRSSISA